jgi:hypothetical protein
MKNKKRINQRFFRSVFAEKSVVKGKLKDMRDYKGAEEKL